MITHVAYQQALNARLQTLVVCTTGTMSLAAVSDGYTRTTGSFLNDGFCVGMEIQPTGFSSTKRRLVKAVTALKLTTTEALTPQSAAGSRSLSVPLPSGRQWEGKEFEPTESPVTGWPFVEQEYQYGPATMIGASAPNSTIIADPVYIVTVNVPDKQGVLAVSRYLDALFRLFPPSLSMAASNGDTVRVRQETAPFAGQVRSRGDRAGWLYVQFTVPLRVYTTNSL